MDIAEFRLLAMNSAELYYQYLEKNGRGRVITRLHKIEPKSSGIVLNLASRFSAGNSLDSLIFELRGTPYTPHQINPVSYDAQAATLFIQPHDRHLFDLIASANPAELSIYSDLKFLVRRVYDWYKHFGVDIHLPSAVPSSPLPSEFFGDPPTPEQRTAIKGALSAPLSYIWGAPGTGKTHCVLSNCVIAYLLAKKKVTLVAPTNNAVEQMLFGLMPVLEKAGFPADCVLRLGVPSAKFAARYPAACESTGLGSRISAIDRQVKIYQNCLALREEARKLALVKSHFPVVADCAVQLQHKYAETCIQLQEHQQNLISLRTQKALAVKAMEHLLQEISEMEQKMRGLRFSIGRFFSLPSCKEQERKLEDLYRSLTEKKELSRTASDKMVEMKDRIRQLNNSYQSCTSEAQSLREGMCAMVSFDRPLLKAVSSIDILSASSDFSGFFSALDESILLNQQQEQYEAYSAVDDDELSARVDALMREREMLENADQNKYEGKSVVAATIDRYISAFPPDADYSYSPDHIFMDEAGYCCLIKSAVLLAANVPITLLGDHMQLPPVCEMNDDAFRNPSMSPVLLWSQSSIYLEDVFAKSFDRMLSDYLNGVEPSFGDMPKYDLTLTHRFGSAIASVLASNVYSPDFCSANPDGTSILVLDAPYAPSPKRASIAEVDAIERFLQEFRIRDSYAILTPYRAQVSLLSHRFPKAAKDGRILTVHASQGREWDTLIFSPVDSSPGSLWFSDSLSQKSRGKAIINTAVSRAKKQLVIVCNRSFWECNRGQLISQLIANGDNIP